MYTTFGGPFFIFLIHQNAFLKVVGKICTQIGGHFHASRNLVKMTRKRRS
jgi:hypothetical protein